MMAEKNEISKTDDPLTSMILSKIVDGSIKVKRCVVCNSPFRNDAEKMFEDGQAFASIAEFLEEKGDDKVTALLVKHHIDNHYKNLARVEVLLDYAENMRAVRKRRLERRELLQSTIDIGLVELTRAIPLPTYGDLGREKERTDLILRIIKSIREGEHALREVDGTEAEIRAIHERFVAVWKAKIDGAQSPEEKKVLYDTLQDFRRLLNKESDA